MNKRSDIKIGMVIAFEKFPYAASRQTSKTINRSDKYDETKTDTTNSIYSSKFI